MLVFHAPTKIDYVIIKVLVACGLTVHIFDKNKVVQGNFFRGFGKVYNIEFLNKDTIGLIKIIDYLPKKNINIYLSSLHLDKMYSHISKCFKGIDVLDQKLNLSLVSSLEFHSSGLIYAYYLNQRASESQRLFIINCELTSFITQEYKIFDKSCVHIGLPIGQLMSILYRLIKSSIFRIFPDKGDAKNDGKKCNILQSPDNNVAIFFHRTDNYGKLYKKDHYFSRFKSSLLHRDNVVQCAVYPDENTPSYLLPLRAPVNKMELLGIFSFIDPKLFFRASISEKRALLILFYRYLEFKAWLKIFNNTTLKNVIIDYDYLFPKPLSLALEHLRVKTFALQDRPTLSMYHKNCGVICDMYAYSGELWHSHGEKNKSIICKKSLKFSSWKNIFFLTNPIKIQNMRFHKDFVSSDTRKKIVFLGYFLSSHSPVTNSLANKQFYKYVNIVAKKFPDSAVFIRMKILDSRIYQNMLREFSNIANIYISTDYHSAGESYALCRDADAIVSVQTSLAEEALAFGKNVILIDNLHSVNEMCTDIYPSDFNFLIARSSAEVVSLIRRIFSSDHKLLASYASLKKSLSTDKIFRRKADIPRAIERLFLGQSNKYTVDS